MEGGQAITLAALGITFLVGLSRAMILFWAWMKAGPSVRSVGHTGRKLDPDR